MHHYLYLKYVLPAGPHPIVEPITMTSHPAGPLSVNHSAYLSRLPTQLEPRCQTIAHERDHQQTISIIISSLLIN